MLGKRIFVKAIACSMNETQTAAVLSFSSYDTVSQHNPSLANCLQSVGPLQSCPAPTPSPPKGNVEACPLVAGHLDTALLTKSKMVNTQKNHLKLFN